MDIEVPQAGVPITKDSQELIAEPWYRALAALFSQFRDTTRGLASAVDDSNTGLASKADKDQTEYGSWTIEFPSDGTEMLALNIPYGWTITKSTTKTTAGTSTVTIKIDGVSIGGSANAASVAQDEQTHSSANVAAVGTDITAVMSSTSGDCAGLTIALEGTRVLA
jgi:hypothetical protein